MTIRGLVFVWAFSVCLQSAHSQPSLVAPIDEGQGTAHALRESYTDRTLYNQATYLTTHNAFANSKAGWEVYAQQSLSFDEQLAYGVWSYMIDLHWCKNKNNSDYLAMAHGGCFFSDFQRGSTHGIPSFESFLVNHAKKWLDNDKKVIITLHLESYTGVNGANALHSLLLSSGVLPYVYFHTPGSLWPTLGVMRATDKRLVIFSDNIRDTGMEVFHTSEYRETQYNLEESPNCERRFDNRDTKNATSILVMNHFYQGSYETGGTDYHQINNPYTKQTPMSLSIRSEKCQTQEGIQPTFIAVDFVEQGDFGGAREQVLKLNQKRLGAVPMSPVIVAPTSAPVFSFMDQLTIQNISAMGWLGSWGAALFESPHRKKLIFLGVVCGVVALPTPLTLTIWISTKLIENISAISTTGWFSSWGAAFIKSPYKKKLIFSGMAFGVVALPTFLTFLPLSIMPIATGTVALGLMAISCKWLCGKWLPYVCSRPHLERK